MDMIQVLSKFPGSEIDVQCMLPNEVSVRLELLRFDQNLLARVTLPPHRRYTHLRTCLQRVFVSYACSVQHSLLCSLLVEIECCYDDRHTLAGGNS
jgi:hypothetical protein